MSDGQDSVTVTTHTNWFQRLLNSVVGVLVGIVLVIVCVGVLFWNEGRAVTTARSLAEGRAAVVPIAPDRVDPANDGRLVYATGTASVEADLADPASGISATGIRLVRSVEMYQWKETERSETRTALGGGQETVTTYSYSKDWSAAAVDSSEFHAPAGHDNPPMPIEEESFQAPEARFGAFVLGPTVLDAVSGAEALPVKKERQAALAEALADIGRPVQVASGRIFLGADPARPAIGDVRIAYSLVPAGPLSLVALQTGATFGSYQTRSGDAVLLVETGRVPAGDMFAHAETENAVLTWILRAAGLLFLFVGFALIAAPLSVIASVVPVLGALVGVGTAALAFGTTLLVGGGTIALAWLVFRPLVALAVLALVLALVAALVALARRRKAPAAAPAA